MVNRKRNRTESEKESGQQKIKMERRRSTEKDKANIERKRLVIKERKKDKTLIGRER